MDMFVDDVIKTGQSIRKYRKLNGLTQEDLAERAKVSTMSVRRYESGNRMPPIETIKRIADALGITVDHLLGYEKEHVIIPGRLKIIVTDNPESSSFIYRIEAADDEAFAIGSKIFEDAGLSIPDHTPDGRIAAALEKLNDKGKAIAVERVEELAKIPDYQRQIPPIPNVPLPHDFFPVQEPPQQAPESTPALQEGTDTTPAEKPSGWPHGLSIAGPDGVALIDVQSGTTVLTMLCPICGQHLVKDSETGKAFCPSCQRPFPLPQNEQK